MLYWICPECGHECSPAIRECPTCTAADSESPSSTALVEQIAVQQPAPPPPAAVSQELLSLAQNFQSPASDSLPSAAPQRLLLAEAKTAAAVAVQAPEKPVQPREPKLSQKLAPLNNRTLQAARPLRWEPLKVSPAPIPARISNPAVARTASPTHARFSLQSAGLAPAGEVNFLPVSSCDLAAFDQSAEPLPSQRRSVAFVRPELPVTERSSGLAVADLAQVEATPLKAMLPHRNGQPKDPSSTPVAYKTSGPSMVGSRLKLTGESLSELLRALKASAEEQDRAGIDAIQAAFSEQPVTGLLAAPVEIVMAPAPPAVQWLLSQKPRFTAIAPDAIGRSTVLAGHQAPPLAGPSLPPQLVNFDHQNSKLRHGGKRMSAWPLTLLLGTLVILGAVSVLQYLIQDHDTKAAGVATTAAPAVRATPVAATPAAPVLQEHPAARSVEVAGVRIVTGPNKKPQLQYIVINHSAGEITGLNIHIAVRSVDALAGPPLFSVSSPIAALGPNQSKEIRADLDSSVKPSSIPDWQSLRTEVLVARQ